MYIVFKDLEHFNLDYLSNGKKRSQNSLRSLQSLRG